MPYFQDYNGVSIVNCTIQPDNATRTFTEHAGGLGHVAATQSLMLALEAAGIPYNLNPASLEAVYEVAFVAFANHRPGHLHQLARLKAEGKVKRVLMWPFFQSFHEPLAVSLADVYCIFANNVLYDDPKRMTFPLCPDTSVFNLEALPNSYSHSRKGPVLIYEKYVDREGVDRVRTFEGPVKAALTSAGIPWRTLVYGEYTLQEYAAALAEAPVMIVLDGWETFGIFLAEAWAMDVPTFVLDVYDSPEVHKANVHRGVSAAPYLSRENGRAWQTPEELISILQAYQSEGQVYSPHRWYTLNVSPEQLAKQLKHIAFGPLPKDNPFKAYDPASLLAFELAHEQEMPV